MLNRTTKARLSSDRSCSIFPAPPALERHKLVRHHCITLKTASQLRKSRNMVAIAGPTGSGKSALALRIAGRFNGEIVNCDSVQIYRFFDIGTAKLPLAER